MQKNIKNKNFSFGHKIQFYLNNELVELENFGARETLLDFLRLEKSLTGSKEGCGEGDCGACTVLVGRVMANELEYQTVNACICLLPSLHASHVITIEGLSVLDGTLHPIQKAMVEKHASQCGFCTPGIVMSLYGAWLKSSQLSHGDIEKSLQGNLCRCTGYGPIFEAAKTITEYGSLSTDKLIQEKLMMKTNLKHLKLKQPVIGQQESSKFILPSSLEDLATLFMEYPNATIVGGATDLGLWITKDLMCVNPLLFINDIPELKKVIVHKETLEIGSCVTYTEAEKFLSKHFPSSKEYFSRIAGEQIRNVGTIGGNLGNGSPIGDLAPLFIALRGTMRLRRGSVSREIEVEKFFLDYKKQYLKESEFIESVSLPLTEKLFLFPYKVSKRYDEDISTVSAVFSFEKKANKIFNARVVFGGMAATPKRAFNVEKILEGKIFDMSIVKLAQLALQNDFIPMSDMRASAKYRMDVSKNLVLKCQVEFSSNKPLKLRGRVQ